MMTVVGRWAFSGWVVAAALVGAGACGIPARAGVGDPQLRTDHPWYPGELAFSTFDRLFATQAELYQRVTGRGAATDEDKALASWYWRNLHYAHGEEGASDCFGRGFQKGEWNREYWTGLFSHGFALCGTTHAQYGAEMNALLGHGRARSVGVTGHNSFEVFLTGGAYGGGRWALLDHDVSTVIFDPTGSRLLSIAEIVPQVATLKDPKFKPRRQRGWRVAGLHDDDAGTYGSFQSVEYFAGYAGPPPIVHLRTGESLHRYLEPGLDDGRTFVFWGRNYNTGGIPGPERSRSWVNQPEKMHGSTEGAGHRDGGVRYGNAAYVYVPNFADGSYKEGVVDEGPEHVTFEFNSPYVIGCTPSNGKPWGVYDAGGRNGLVVTGAPCPVEVSTDHGKTWQHPAGPPASAGGDTDFTDHVKGRRHYWLRFGAGAAKLRESKLGWRTTCQANTATMPRVHDGTNRVTFLAGGKGVFSAGPDKAQVEQHVVEGGLDSPSVTLEVTAPRGEKTVRLHAAAWQASGAPPSPDVAYHIEYSTDAGTTWAPVVKDWRIIRRSPEPADFWSQSFCWGDIELPGVTGPVRVRFRNTGGKAYRTVEAHLVYDLPTPSPLQVTFAWDETGHPVRSATHTYPGTGGVADGAWVFDAGKVLKTRRISYRFADGK
jgi:hypothetical protein